MRVLKFMTTFITIGSLIYFGGTCRLHLQCVGWCYRHESNSVTLNLEAGHPVTSWRFSSPPKLPVRFWGPTSLLFNGWRHSFPMLKQPGRAADHSPLSSAKVKNERSYISTPPIYTLLITLQNVITLSVII